MGNEREWAKSAEDEIERLEASNTALRDACEFVVKWLGHTELEDSDGANVSFKKALSKCRAALNPPTEESHD